ncbi:hypothetical protein [Microcoleus sp. MOSTC5]
MLADRFPSSNQYKHRKKPSSLTEDVGRFSSRSHATQKNPVSRVAIERI